MTAGFKDFFVQGFVLACLVAAALFLPWLPMKVIAWVIVAYVVYSVIRHPRAFYRRAFWLVSAACLLPGFATIAFRGAARAKLPEGGWVSTAFELNAGEGPSPWLWFGIATLCLIGDIVYLLRFDKQPAPPGQLTSGHLTVYEEETGGIGLRTDVTVVGPGEGGVIRGATLRLWLRHYRCELHATQENEPVAPRLPVGAGAERRLGPGETVALFLYCHVPDGFRAKWLRLRARHSVPLMPRFSGLRLIAAPEPLQEPIPLALEAGGQAPPAC